MSRQKLRKSLISAGLTVVMALSGSCLAFGATQVFPNGSIVNVEGVNYLIDVQGNIYSGWFMDAEGNWYYFNDTDKSMKTGWYLDNGNGYWYYLNPSDGKMATGWQVIGGKDYYFGIDGMLYVNTTTPDGAQVDGNGERIINIAAETGNASAKVDYKGSYQLKGDEWIDITSYYWNDNVLYLQGTYCDGIVNPNPQYEADSIHFVPIKENVMVIIDSNTKMDKDLTEFKEWLDGAWSWFNNAELGIRLDGDYVTEITDTMVIS